jgi:hypothetical protein
LKDVFNAIIGYTEKVTRDYQHDWEIARWINYYSVVPHLRKNRIFKLTDIARFDWEKQEDPVIKSKEEINKLVKQWQKKG